MNCYRRKLNSTRVLATTVFYTKEGLAAHLETDGSCKVDCTMEAKVEYVRQHLLAKPFTNVSSFSTPRPISLQ